MTPPGKGGGFQAFTFEAKGRVDRIITPVTIFPPFDPKSGANPAGHSAKALWDTGSTRSVIRPEVVAALGLRPTGTSVSRTAGGVTTNPTHVINITLPNRTLIAGVLVSESPNLDGFDAIVGMDVITLGDFAVTNVGGQTLMSYRCPSIQRIDYVVELNRMVMARVRRNGPCPCGKKKADGSPMKFKNCCALTMRV